MIFLLILPDAPDDRVFMEELYLNYRWLIYSEIRKILQDPWAVEDILQTVLVKLIPKIGLLRTLDRSKLISYLIKTAQTTSYKYLDKENRGRKYTYIDDLDSFEEETAFFDPGQLRLESRDHLQAVWKQLDPKHQHILELKYILEWSNEEIAADVGVSPASVRMLLTRARKHLKEVLEQNPG